MEGSTVDDGVERASDDDLERELWLVTGTT